MAQCQKGNIELINGNDSKVLDSNGGTRKKKETSETAEVLRGSNQRRLNDPNGYSFSIDSCGIHGNHRHQNDNVDTKCVDFRPSQ